MSEKIELPQGWEHAALGTLVKKITNKVMPIELPDLQFVGMDSIATNGLTPHQLYTFSDFKSAANKFEIDQVLYGRMRPYLNKVYKANFTGVCSGEFIVMECLKSIMPDYFKYLLHHRGFVKYANEKTTGDRPRVDATQCRACRIGESGSRICSRFEQCNKFFARKRASPHKMLGQEPLGIGPPCITRGLADDRRSPDPAPLAATPDSLAVRVGVEREFVVLSAEGTT